MCLSFFIYYWLILYRKCKNQIYFHLLMILLLIIKLLFEKIFISVLMHGYALKLTFCILFYYYEVISECIRS
ncbi:hypothetical protein BB539_24855 [Escherichia coli]|nr:hypothetical protein CCE14_18995 [Escherichia coli]PBU21505.1 hypothetical protein BB539_24855 [Escherichia coli]RFA68388.1 hypothetical protein CA895_16100 [Escherichia coli]